MGGRSAFPIFEGYSKPVQSLPYITRLLWILLSFCCFHGPRNAITSYFCIYIARLGVALAPSLKRRSEVETLKSSVETIWGNSRPLPDFLYLKHLLDNKQETTAGNTVVDVRLGRVFYKIIVTCSNFESVQEYSKPLYSLFY